MDINLLMRHQITYDLRRSKMNYFQKANEYYNSRNYRRAIDMYEKAIKIKDNESSSLYNSAVCFIKLKEYRKAIDLLNSALKLKRESKYFFNLGYCYTMLKDNKKALIYFNNAWCLNNKDSDCEKAINTILKNYIAKSK
ncbi:tetratricopeptide repeat protein [Clostridium luticellarii]|jgi:tetratricopeptide (TPR) repeat protein|nr:tetratricopeptide repeat protein [Clostridium luticellarii]